MRLILNKHKLLLMAGCLDEEKKKKKKKRMKDFLDAEGRLRRDRRIPRCALLEPNESPWLKLYGSSNDQSMITVTGFDHKAFRQLLQLYKPYFYGYSPWTGQNDGATYRQLKKNIGSNGCPRKVTAAASLGLALAWYRFKGALFILQGWFGFTGTHTSVWIRFARRMLLLCLWKHPLARAKMPSDDKVNQYVQIIERQHPELKNVYCVADGLKMDFEATAVIDVQSMFYNGWKHGHYITNLFVFAADGRIIIFMVNAPGSVHDSTLADWGDVYEALEKVYLRTGAICCLDSAFSSTKADYLVMSSEDLSKAKTAQDVLVMRAATSLRQSAEWGMRAIQGAFPRLKDRLKYEECPNERKVYLLLVPLLYNMRLELVGLNQIRNVYVLEWSKDTSNVMTGWY